MADFMPWMFSFAQRVSTCLRGRTLTLLEGTALCSRMIGQSHREATCHIRSKACRTILVRLTNADIQRLTGSTVFNGPNAPLANGSLIPAIEKMGDHFIKWIDKFVREDIRSFCIKPEAIEAFSKYSDAWMPRTICAFSSR